VFNFGTKQNTANSKLINSLHYNGILEALSKISARLNDTMAQALSAHGLAAAAAGKELARH